MPDSQMQRGQQWLKTLLQLSGINTEIKAELEAAVTGEEQIQEPDRYWLTIDEKNLAPEQIQVFIGTDGVVLDAIQYLANSILNLNQSHEQQGSYTVELNGYRIKRQAEIRAIAETAAMQARNTAQEVEIKSLSSAERRQVHTYLKDFSDLETFSRGKEPHRNLVVRLALPE